MRLLHRYQEEVKLNALQDTKRQKKKKPQKAKLLTPAERLVLHDCELSRENIIYLNILNLPLSNVYVHSVVQVYCLRAH